MSASSTPRRARSSVCSARGTVAVVGASNDPHKIGNAVFGNLLRMRLRRRCYPVNPDAKPVAGVAGHRRVRDIPGGVDLAVVAVPAAVVPRRRRGLCAAKGARAWS